MHCGTGRGADRDGQGPAQTPGRRRGALLLALALLAAGPARAAPPLRVEATNYPLAWFAGRIGGNRVTVGFAVPPGIDPAFWEPPTAAVLDIQQADLIVLNGADYERWVRRASLPHWRVLDSSRAFRDRFLPAGSGTTHQHGPQGAHAHTGTAFTTWLDPHLAIAQAAALRHRLVELDPSGRAHYDAGFEELAADLRALDGALARAFGPLSGQPWLASHPVFQYLARRYGLVLEAVTWEPEADPGEDAWAALEALRARHPGRWMLWEAEPLPATRERLHGLGIEVVVFAPGGNRPAHGDYLGVMQANLQAIEGLAQ